MRRDRKEMMILEVERRGDMLRPYVDVLLKIRGSVVSTQLIRWFTCVFIVLLRKRRSERTDWMND